ncbi:hypothetical protein HDV00_000994 [Rhizophlyctis rosea]|nr:hypothetical protein HDV00_000994 [Rhizophlyctis rosea]
MTTYSGLIVNVETGKCLSAPENDGGGIFVTDCKPGDSRQTINVTNADKTRSTDDQGHQLSTSYTKGNNGTIDTWNGAWYWSGQCGSGNDCDFHVWSFGDTGGLNNSPFKWWGWGRQGGNDAAVHEDNFVRQTKNYNGHERGKWLTYDAAKACRDYGVPLKDCTSNQILPKTDGPECFQYEQWKRGPAGCPLANGCKLAGLPLNANDCTREKLDLAKQCQSVDLTNCTADALNERRDKCYNLGLCIDSNCTAAGSFGGCTTAKISQIEADCAAEGLADCSAGKLQTKLLADATSDAAEQQAADNRATLAAFTAAMNASLTAETAPPPSAPSNQRALYIGIGVGVFVIILIIVLIIVRS